MNNTRRNFRQRLQHKPALMKTRMRQPQELRIFLDVTVKQQIEIDRTRPVFHFSSSTQRKFNAQQTRHHLLRRR